jgi:carboxyl-terminal processing protease
MPVPHNKTDQDKPVDAGQTDAREDDAAADEATGRGQRTAAPSRVSLVLVAILAGTALFMSGYSLGSRVATTPGTPASEEARFEAFWDVYALIQKDYAGSPKPSQDELVRAAIKGMMDSLNDPYSYYQGPVEFESSLLNVGGQAEGIGVQVQLQTVDVNGDGAACEKIGNGCELAVVRPIPGSPAEAAGVKAGDVITAVDGTSLDGLTMDQATAKIRGPKDTTVTLRLDRNGQKIDLSIVRKIYSQPEVNSKTYAGGAVEYISVAGVNKVASSQFELALREALAAGRHSIIIDLRGNPGGYVDQAITLASQFIPSGTLAYQEDATGKQVEITATSGGLATDPSVKVVVLVDKNTASAAEILAGALQARGRAKLVGEKTYGKGVVQAWLPLPNDQGGIHLTIARWLTPNKVWIQGKGLTPDVAVSSDGARAGTDPVLDAALQLLGYPAESGASPSPSGSPSVSPTPSLLPSPSPS